MRDRLILKHCIVDLLRMSDQKFIKSANIVAVESQIATADRTSRNGHKGGVLWFTGLSGSGKSTLATELEQRLFNAGYNVYVLDSDNVRHGLSSNLGFSPADRTENVRRIGEIAALFANAGLIVITAFISPYRKDRETARTASSEDFHEIFIDADLSVCEKRDQKGLYRKARRGKISEFTGISAPYEAPETPEFTVYTEALDIAQSVAALAEYVANAFGQRKD